MEKHFEIIRDRFVEIIVIVLLLLSGIALFFAGQHWAWGCYILSALDLSAFTVLFIAISKDIYNDTVERIIEKTVERVENTEPNRLLSR
ncbi:hypothetical protein ACFLWG_01750 [Chloroflexota bacterium]